MKQKNSNGYPLKGVSLFLLAFSVNMSFVSCVQAVSDDQDGSKTSSNFEEEMRRRQPIMSPPSVPIGPMMPTRMFSEQHEEEKGNWVLNMFQMHPAHAGQELSNRHPQHSIEEETK